MYSNVFLKMFPFLMLMGPFVDGGGLAIDGFLFSVLLFDITIFPWRRNFAKILFDELVMIKLQQLQQSNPIWLKTSFFKLKRNTKLYLSNYYFIFGIIIKDCLKLNIYFLFAYLKYKIISFSMQISNKIQRKIPDLIQFALKSSANLENFINVLIPSFKTTIEYNNSSNSNFHSYYFLMTSLQIRYSIIGHNLNQIQVK